MTRIVWVLGQGIQSKGGWPNGFGIKKDGFPIEYLVEETVQIPKPATVVSGFVSISKGKIANNGKGMLGHTWALVRCILNNGPERVRTLVEP